MNRALILAVLASVSIALHDERVPVGSANLYALDPELTEQIRQLEQQFGNAIVHKDAQALDRLVGPEFTLRIADLPDTSLPRAIWMDNTLNRIKAESFEHHHDAARKLADDLAVISLVFTQKASFNGQDFSGESYLVDFWKRRAGGWQIIARYGTRVGTTPRRPRPPLPLPAPTDTDPQLTEQLRPLEEELGEAVRHGFKDAKTVGRLVGPEFTFRSSDAPEISVPRGEWARPSRTDELESVEERYQAARKLADDVVAVSLLWTQRATRDGGDRSGDLYLVDVWRKRDDRWQIIARYSGRQAGTLDGSPQP